MSGATVEQSWAISAIGTDGVQFQIAIGREANGDTDPVAASYRTGSLAHLGPLLDIARAALVPGDRVVDLGAHVGGFALLAAALGCEVLAVEASPRNAGLLRASVDQNGFRNVHVVQAAVSDRGGSVAFCSHGPWGHVATPTTGMPAVEVPAVAVDDLLGERGWAGVRFVKLDVEGSEVRAVRGMERLLRAADGPPVYFESNNHALNFYGHTDADLKGELRRLGYEVEVRPGMLIKTADGEEQTDTCVDYFAAKRLPPPLAGWVR